MDILKSSPISPFGGLNFVLEAFDKLKVGEFLDKNLPTLPKQTRYSWKDIFYSYWSVFFCGGDCAEDLAINLKQSFKSNPRLNIPSPDRILNRMKSLAGEKEYFRTPRGTVDHQFSLNPLLNELNMKLTKKLSLLQKKNNILDYDNTLIFTEKADAANTYKRQYGYCPGVGIIKNNIVYVENRNGNSNPETLQKDTLKRMFDTLEENNIHIGVFRADGGSYTLHTIAEVVKRVDKFFVRARISNVLAETINRVGKWDKIKIGSQTMFRSSVLFTPFEGVAKRMKDEHLLKQYRLVITKEPRDDKQINMFTGEAYNYRAILTNDFEKSDDEVVFFYNARGTIEREFDILKNDFGWNNMPFSKLEQNTVFLIITAMCRNLYHFIITNFSKRFKHLKPNFRIKKFIFRFIVIPAKWIKTGRSYKLRLYGSISFKT